MPISGATLLNGATVSATGGTSKTFTDVGETIKNGKKVADLTVTDLRVRPTITVINKPPVLNNLGIYSKGKRTQKLVMPKILASGAITFPLVEIRIEDHPEMTVAEVDALCCYAAQMLCDPDFQSFNRTGSLS